MELLSSVPPTPNLVDALVRSYWSQCRLPETTCIWEAEETALEGPPFLMLRKRCPFPFYQTSPTWFTLHNFPLSHVLFTLVTLTKKTMEDLFWVAIKYQLPEYLTKISNWGNAATSYTDPYNIFYFNLLLYFCHVSKPSLPSWNTLGVELYP